VVQDVPVLDKIFTSPNSSILLLPTKFELLHPINLRKNFCPHMID